VKNLNFAYNKNLIVLNDFNLSVMPNAITCISGNDNSGKTTLLKIFTGGYTDFNGSVNINHVPIQNYSLKSLRSKTGILLHEQELFDGTIYENITLGREDISIDDIITLSEKLGFNNFMAAFPNSFKSNINELRKTFSSSLIKKILLLRALVHNPILIVLEEPWTGLDQNVRLNIQNYLLEIAESKTIVISTNENHFIQKCQHHIEISNGHAITKK
jgi:ABC-type bacteriocin/lantibiotic exporter with double-glycine peptidase domain